MGKSILKASAVKMAKKLSISPKEEGEGVVRLFSAFIEKLRENLRKSEIELEAHSSLNSAED